MTAEHQLRLQAEQNDPIYPPYDFTFRGPTLGAVAEALTEFLKPGGFLRSTHNQTVEYRVVLTTEWESYPFPETVVEPHEG